MLMLSLIFTTVEAGVFSSYAETVNSELSADSIEQSEKNEDELTGTGGSATPSEPASESEPPKQDNTSSGKSDAPAESKMRAADAANPDEIIPDPAVVIDDIGYPSINQAIKEVKKGTLVIQRDITEDVVIPAEAEVEIDLNGYTWTNESSHTIINRGTLVITNSDEETIGVVDNITDQKAAIWNEADGDITIEANCLITRSEETGIGFSIKGDNSYNTIINQGSLTIQNEASVTQGPGGGGYSHLISNGWRSEAEDSSDNTASVTINGGTLSGGLTNIENYHFGEVHISDGTFLTSTPVRKLMTAITL